MTPKALSREIKFRALDKVDKQMRDWNWVKQSPMYLLNIEESSFVFMQFTGLHDKNGKEIYEGDVVKYKYESSEDKRIDVLSCIEFSDGSFHPLPYDDTDETEYYTYKTYDFEVIGNIYENPELLTKENKYGRTN